MAVETVDVNVGLQALLGMRIDELTADRVVITIDIGPQHLQPFGIVHGGVHCAVVETAASMGASTWFGDRGSVVGVSNQTDFIRALQEGILTGIASPIHRGRSQQLWMVEITDEQSRLVARGQVRVQNLAK
jgi:1,4-dihydroxy-2-naphthoyl-CoA hydrolase